MTATCHGCDIYPTHAWNWSVICALDLYSLSYVFFQLRIGVNYRGKGDWVTRDGNMENNLSFRTIFEPVKGLCPS